MAASLRRNWLVVFALGLSGCVPESSAQTEPAPVPSPRSSAAATAAVSSSAAAKPGKPARKAIAVVGEAGRDGAPAGANRSGAKIRVGEQTCREQRAQDFLLRKGQIAKIGAGAEERAQIEAARKRSIDYRTLHYGRFPGFGQRSDNPHPPRFYAKRTRFMGIQLVLHEKVAPALACVEQALERDCQAQPYRPRAVSGLRLKNTYTDYEVSNHVYGIALDIDSNLNPCCGCIGAWKEHESCRKKVESEFERMAMPRCWVEVFERYGFHWLGHDELRDTMHFEFLGDPDAIFE